MGHISVAKFGGTSVADFEAMLRCAGIIAADANIRVVVVSAPAGVTNQLVALSRSAITGEDREIALQSIRSAVFKILQNLNSQELNQTIEQLLEDLDLLTLMLSKAYSPQLADELLSFGERFSSYLFTAILRQNQVNAKRLDVRKVIKTDSSFTKANPILSLIEYEVDKTLKPLIMDHVVVLEGFVGQDRNGITTTLGRGGSDYSAALIAEALGAQELQIWTDVAGIYTTDPRVVSKAGTIDRISFDEAAELATFGAKVLHPATLWPAVRKGIRVFVGSSKDTTLPGTWIEPDFEGERPIFRGIALRRNQTLLTVNSFEMFHAQGFLAHVFSVLAQHHIGVDLVTTSEVSVALTLDTPNPGEPLQLDQSVIDELQSQYNIQLTIETGLNLIAVIGNNLQLTPGISGKVFKLLEQYNVRLLCHGASTHNLCFLVQEEEGEAVIQKLHAAFFEEVVAA